MINNLAIVYDDKFQLHKPPFEHAEHPGRVDSIINYLKEKNFTADWLKPERASEEDILLIHTQRLYDFIKREIEKGSDLLDAGDTYIVKDSWEAAHLAAGSAITSLDLVFNKNYPSVFNLVRPPGHHAESNRPMGFCLFNNAALCAKYALEKYDINRVMLIDWDVHHGNGTQEIFYTSQDVYYISLHQYPLYPGTGKESEKGEAEGKGYTLNFPLPPGTKGNIYVNIFKEIIVKELEKYDPQLIIISAGFDAHKDDPLANINLAEKDFAEMTIVLKDFAAKKNIPAVSFLEGGYNLKALSSSVYEHLIILNK